MSNVPVLSELAKILFERGEISDPTAGLESSKWVEKKYGKKWIYLTDLEKTVIMAEENENNS